MTRYIAVFYLLSWAFSCYAQPADTVSKKHSNFWEKVGYCFLDSTASFEMRDNARGLDSIRSVALMDNRMNFLALQNELDTLRQIKGLLDSSVRSDIDKQMSDYIGLAELVAGDSATNDPNVVQRLAYNSRVVHMAYDRGKASLLRYTLTCGVEDTRDVFLENLNLHPENGSKKSFVSNETYLCNCHFRLNEKYFDDRNLEVYLVNGHYFALARADLGVSGLDDINMGYIDNYEHYATLSRNLDKYFQATLDKDTYHMIYLFSYNDFDQRSESYKAYQTKLGLLSDLNKWYIFFFYKRNLYYISPLKPCVDKELEVKIF